MKKRRIGAVAGALLLLLWVGWRAGGFAARRAPAAPEVVAEAPTPVEARQSDGARDAGGASGERGDDDDFAYDTGASVRLPRRGVVRVETWRDDGTPEPLAIHRLIDCERWKPIGFGANTAYRVEPGPCRIEVWRTDGRTDTPHQFADVTVSLDEEVAVSFTLPSTRAGGVGVEAELTEAGAELREVLPGSPADEAGLEPGDLVVAVDCVEVADMSEEAYRDAISGPEGTPVNVTVAFAGDTGLVEEIVETTTTFLPFD